MDPFTLAFLIERLAWLGGGVAVVYGFTRQNEWTFPVARKTVRWIVHNRPGARMERKMSAAVTGLNEKLDKVLAVVYPNGGSSLPDAMARLEVGQANIQNQLSILKSQVGLVRDQAGLMTFSADVKGRNAYTSPLLLEKLGATSEEQVGFGWKNFIHFEDREKYFQEWLYAVEDERDFLSEVRLCNPKNGVCFKCRVTAEVVKMDERLVGWTGRVEPLDK